MRGGHYVGYVRCQQDEICEDIRKDGSRKSPWYYIRNSHVKRVSLSEVLYSEAYLLFYEKCTLWWISRILKHCTMCFTILSWHRLCQFSIKSFWHFKNATIIMKGSHKRKKSKFLSNHGGRERLKFPELESLIPHPIPSRQANHYFTPDTLFHPIPSSWSWGYFTFVNHYGFFCHCIYDWWEASIRQKPTQMGKEGDANPFTDVTVDSISQALHKCGY